jgi:hypothetical protein
MTPHQLAATIRTFIDDNERHHDVRLRWLSDQVNSWLRTIIDVGNGNLGPEQRAEVNAFRAEELQEQIDAKTRDIASLERELSKTKAATRTDEVTAHG